MEDGERNLVVNWIVLAILYRMRGVVLTPRRPRSRRACVVSAGCDSLHRHKPFSWLPRVEIKQRLHAAQWKIYISARHRHKPCTRWYVASVMTTWRSRVYSLVITLNLYHPLQINQYCDCTCITATLRISRWWCTVSKRLGSNAYSCVYYYTVRCTDLCVTVWSLHCLLNGLALIIKCSARWQVSGLGLQIWLSIPS